MKTRLNGYFRDYALSHTTRGNKITHILGIPMIVFSILGLLGHVAIAQADAGLILWALVVLFYSTLDAKLSMAFGLVSLGFYLLGRAVSIELLWVVFVIGWIFQFVGHYYYEKKSPSFLKNILHLFIGPLWILKNLLKRLKKLS